jgi:hypothetical protein
MNRRQSTALPNLLAPPETLPPRRRLRRREASVYLRAVWGIERAPATLAKLACIGGGPPFYKDGRIPIYDRPDLDDWAQSRLSAKMRSTSDRGAT